MVREYVVLTALSDGPQKFGFIWHFRLGPDRLSTTVFAVPSTEQHKKCFHGLRGNGCMPLICSGGRM